MRRFVKCRKQLSNDEARTRIANLQKNLSVQEDNINYWHQRIGKELEFIDMFMLGVDKIKSPKEFIEMAMKTQEYLVKRIDDYKRFLTEPYRRFIY